jgi:hypothetical protein
MLRPIPVHNACFILWQNLQSVYLSKLCDKINFSVNNVSINFEHLIKPTLAINGLNRLSVLLIFDALLTEFCFDVVRTHYI